MKRTPISKRQRWEILERDGFKCRYCGRKAPDVRLEIDHQKPVAGGGCNCTSNLVTACFDCNRGKGVSVIGDNSGSPIPAMMYRAFQLEKYVAEHFNEKTWDVEISLLASLLMGWTESEVKARIDGYDPNDEADRQRFLNWMKGQSFRYILQVEEPA